MKRTPTLLLALLTPLLMIFSGMADAASCTNGQALSKKVINGLSCNNSSCHGSALNANGIGVAAGNPGAIENAMGSVNEMIAWGASFSQSDYEDLAEWLILKPTCPSAASAAPSTWDFGSITLGNTSGTKVFTITNTGAVTGTLTYPASTTMWPSSKTCGATISAGASCTVTIAYKPAAAGANDSFTYTVSGTGGFSIGPLTGSSPAAATPANLTYSGNATFGSVQVGNSSVTNVFTVTNTGTTGATGVAFTNTNSAEFVVSNNSCGSSIGGGSQCNFSVKYTPTAAGADSATLSIAYTSGTTLNIAMTGTGTSAAAPSLQATPVSLAFGTTSVGSTSSTQSVSITNVGTSTATTFTMANGDATHFPVSGNTCGTSLAAGASCSLNVAYAPNAVGTNNAALTFSYAGGTNVTVQLSGTGTAAATANLATSPTGGTFGNVTVGQSSPALAVTLTNSGGAAATGVSFNNSNGAEFVVGSNSCGTTVNAGASCNFNITYTPAAAGADSATLTINSSGGAAVVMSLTGTGVSTAPQAGQLSLPAALTMADQQVGTTSAVRAVTLSNLGPGAVNVLSIVSNNSGEFAIGSNGCGTLQANTACTFNLTFTPAAAGGRGATITITSNGLNSPQNLAVSGNGTTGVPPPAATVDLIEYYHASFGHYFITYLPDEITKLDNGTFVGWARTGRQLKAWTAKTNGDQVPVCRFFTTFFAPKSSHFYTPDAPECTGLKPSSVWGFEGEVFYTQNPTFAGVCPANTLPVYRMYNNGMSGAPNHRYTTDFSVREQMLAAGWIPEGAGTIGVIMCSPP